MPYQIWTKEPPMIWLVREIPFEIAAGKMLAKVWDKDQLWSLETTTGKKLVLRSEHILAIKEVTNEEIAKAKEEAEKQSQGGKLVRPTYGIPGGRGN